MTDGELTLRGQRVVLRSVREDEVDALVRILGESSVAAWWGENDAASLRKELAEVAHAFTVFVDGTIAGLLYADEEPDPNYRSVGLDIGLATAFQGRGYGPEALRVVVEHFVARGHHRFTIDPAAGNERAIRAYGALGFRPVGILRKYERAPDGTWRDGLLMDLLAEELSPAPARRAGLR